MKYRKYFIAVLIISMFSSTYLIKFLSKENSANLARMLPVVNLAKVVFVNDLNEVSSIGVIKAVQGVEISAPIAGVITSISMQSGKKVQAGDILLKIKNDDLQATVSEDQAKFNLAKSKQRRSQELIKEGYISRQDGDQIFFDLKQAEAKLKHDKILLDNTIIKAPFSGELGIFQVDLGQYLAAGDEIVSLQDKTKMFVDFSVSEKESDLIKLGGMVNISIQQSQHSEWQGKITALGSSLDNDTRSLPVRAEIEPAYFNLTPGMYVEVSIQLSTSKNKPAIPQNAVVYSPYGNFVYLYKKGLVRQSYVDLGQKFNDLIIINKGVALGDDVVISGQQKLFNGAKVEVSGV